MQKYFVIAEISDLDYVIESAKQLTLPKIDRFLLLEVASGDFIDENYETVIPKGSLFQLYQLELSPANLNNMPSEKFQQLMYDYEVSGLGSDSSFYLKSKLKKNIGSYTIVNLAVRESHIFKMGDLQITIWPSVASFLDDQDTGLKVRYTRNPSSSKIEVDDKSDPDRRHLREQNDSEVIISSFNENDEIRYDAHINKKNVGYILLKEKGDNTLWVDGVYIVPQFRGKGLVNLLFAKIEEEQRGKTLELLAKPYKDKNLNSNELIKMYKKLGFKSNQENKKYMTKNISECQSQNFLTLLKESLIIEGRLEDVKNKYSEMIPEDTIVYLSENDPSGNNKYLMWMTKMVNNGHNPVEVIKAIQEFHKGGSRFSSRDINSYSFEKLSSELQTKSKKKERTLGPEDAQLIYEDEEFLIHKLKSYKGSKILGMGTKWCISGKSDQTHWDEYSDAHIEIFTVFSKKRQTPQFSNGELIEEGDPKYKIAIVFEPKEFTQSRTSRGQWAFPAEIESKYGSEISDAQDQLLAGNYMRSRDPQIEYMVRAKFKKLGEEVVERQIERLYTPVKSPEDFLKSFFGDKFNEVIKSINSTRSFSALSHEEMMRLHQKQLQQMMMQEMLKKPLLEYINYPQDKFIAKWEAEGRPFEDELGSNGENWIPWLEQYDPTQKKKYVNWMITKYLKDGIRKLEDIPSRLFSLLDLYDKLSRKNKLKPEHKDINRIQTLSDLYGLVKSYQKAEEDSQSEAENSFYESGEAELFYDSPNYKIVIPKTEKASCFFGKETQWCTATSSNNRFEHYNQKGSLYIILEKKTNKRWQFHFQDEQFMDENDKRIDIFKFLEEKPEIKKAFGFGDLEIKKQETEENSYLYEQPIKITKKVTGYFSKTKDISLVLSEKQHSYDDKPAVIKPDGTQVWCKNGELHRDDDKPAVVRPDGTQEWYKNSKRHRDGDKPAIIMPNGTQEWYKNNERHRDGDKPANIRPSGTQEWYKNNELHRDGDKPAIIFSDGTQWWWYKDGKRHRDGDKPAIINSDGTQEWYKDGKLIRREEPLNERTLYHGTIITHKDSIKKHGVYATVGDWVKDTYGLSFDEDELEPLVFAGDKNTLDAAVGAMRFGISKILGKSMSEITVDDIKKYGLLVIFHPDDEDEPDSLGSFKQRPPRGEEGFYDEYPIQTEPNDYFSSEDQIADGILTGNKLVSFLNRANVLPSTSQDVKILRNKIMRYLAKIKDKETMGKVKNVPDGEIPELYKKARKMWGSEFGDYILENKNTLNLNEGHISINKTLLNQVFDFIWSGHENFDGVAYRIINLLMDTYEDIELQQMKPIILRTIKEINKSTKEYVPSSEVSIEQSKSSPHMFFVEFNQDIAPDIGSKGYKDKIEFFNLIIETDDGSGIGGELRTKNKQVTIKLNVGLDIFSLTRAVMPDKDFWKNVNDLPGKMVEIYKARLKTYLEHEMIHIIQSATGFVSNKGLSHTRGLPSKNLEHDKAQYDNDMDYYTSSDIEFYPNLKNAIDEYVSLYDELNRETFLKFLKTAQTPKPILAGMKRKGLESKYRKFIKLLYTALDTIY